MPLYPLGVGLGGHQCLFERFGQEKNLLPLAGREIPFRSPACSVVTTLTELPPLKYIEE
jgi:hypothetical protein